MANGFSFNTFGKKIGVTPSTLKKWRQLYAEFDGAAQLGEAESLHFWESLLIGAAAGQIKGNAKLVELVMKCRFLWSEKQHIELTGSLETQLRRMSDQELESKLREIRTRQSTLSEDTTIDDDESIENALEKLRK